MIKNFQVTERVVIKEHGGNRLVQVKGLLRGYTPQYFEFWSCNGECNNWIVTEDIALMMWQIAIKGGPWKAFSWQFDYKAEIVKCIKCGAYFLSNAPHSEKLKDHCDFCMDICKKSDTYFEV